MDLAQSIRVGLAKANKKQSWLAGEMGVSRNYISMLCSGDKTPSVSNIREISKIFGVSASEFIKWGE